MTAGDRFQWGESLLRLAGSRVALWPLGDGDVPALVEIFGDRRMSLMPWSTVRSVANLPEGIEVRTGESGILLIRARAFHSEDTRTAFLEEARKRIPAGTLSGAHGET